MKTLKAMLILIIVLSLAGCEDVINVDLDTAAPRLVIDASIDWEKGTSGNQQTIRLSTTTGYYSAAFPTVSGATVTVANSAATVFNFEEIPGTGEYVCSNFLPVIGETYTLTVLLNGQVYTAVETLAEVPDIENNITQNNSGGFSGDEIEITYYYQDNGAQENYYLQRIVTPRVAFPEFEIENDENTQGNLVAEMYAHEDLEVGDLVNIRLYGISERYYHYFNRLLTASGNGNGPFATTPAAVRGNIVNQTSSENFAFGFFRLSEVAVKNYTIQ